MAPRLSVICAGSAVPGITAVTRAAGWSVEAKSSFVRRLDENDPTGESTKHLLLCMDAPRHTRVRKVGNRCFTPRALAGLEDDLRDRAQRIVWAAKRNGTVALTCSAIST